MTKCSWQNNWEKTAKHLGYIYIEFHTNNMWGLQAAVFDEAGWKLQGVCSTQVSAPF